jgi:hypothetical protein
VVGNTIVQMIMASENSGNVSFSVSFEVGISKEILDAMKARPDLTYTITYAYGGVLYKIVIPAGYDLNALLNAAGGIDLLTLIDLFGATPV